MNPAIVRHLRHCCPRVGVSAATALHAPFGWCGQFILLGPAPHGPRPRSKMVDRLVTELAVAECMPRRHRLAKNPGEIWFRKQNIEMWRWPWLPRLKTRHFLDRAPVAIESDISSSFEL